jgi:hypothetical protein
MVLNVTFRSQAEFPAEGRGECPCCGRVVGEVSGAIGPEEHRHITVVLNAGGPLHQASHGAKVPGREGWPKPPIKGLAE